MGLFLDKGVSSENNPMDETLCIRHIAPGKIRAWTSAKPRSYRARIAGDGTLCSMGIMASYVRNRRSRSLPPCPVRRGIGHRTAVKRRAGSRRRRKETSPTITPPGARREDRKTLAAH
jgi:hypothetical protein